MRNLGEFRISLDNNNLLSGYFDTLKTGSPFDRRNYPDWALICSLHPRSHQIEDDFRGIRDYSSAHWPSTQSSLIQHVQHAHERTGAVHRLSHIYQRGFMRGRLQLS